MKKVLAALFASALFLTGCSSSGGATNMGAADFIAKIGEPGVVIVDVRTPEEFAAGHLQGAVNLDVSAATFDSQISALDKNVAYAVYCRSGNRSTIAVGKMSDAGFTNLFNFNKGGFAELAAAGAPTA
ncbi:MAG: rhodanese-like domain-containing protein [Candidatus Nanopelagicaceae bacterium]|jgi:rhodanese-related sulfurtransferase|nr:rhodanese-like domain-containing protein [Candidatus Nanopelagicaceae bacterium]